MKIGLTEKMRDDKKTIYQVHIEDKIRDKVDAEYVDWVWDGTVEVYTDSQAILHEDKLREELSQPYLGKVVSAIRDDMNK